MSENKWQDKLYGFAEPLAGILFQFGLATAIISLMFFTIVKDKEGEIVLHEVDSIVKDLNNDIRLVDLNGTLRNAFASRLSQAQIDKNADKQVEDSNKVVLKSAIKLNAIIFIISMVLAFALKFLFKIPFKNIIFPGLAGVAVIVMIELFFLYMIVANYIVVDSNDVKQFLLGALASKYKK